MVAHPEYGLVPEYFEGQCRALNLPLNTILDGTSGFIDAIIGLPNPPHRVMMRRLIEKGNHLRAYLHASGCSILDAGRVSNEVLDGLREAGVPLSSREKTL